MSTNFRRENRYFVFKKSKLTAEQARQLSKLQNELSPTNNVKECLIVEHDWPCYESAWQMIEAVAEGGFSCPYQELAKANKRVAELEQNQLPIENGKNRYGLDVSYFRNVINRELNRSLENHKPDELARVFARLSRTADKSVMFEPEFSNKFAIEKKIEFKNDLIKHLRNNYTWSHSVYEFIDSFGEQLRKGGES